MLFKKQKPTHTRSVVFYRNSYYHFYYLAKALRKRGWDALTVNIEPVNGPNANYYHGEDINLYHHRDFFFNRNIRLFFKRAIKRFKLLHFCADGQLSLYPKRCLQENPEDILEWKRHGNKIAYTISGCNSATTPDSVAEWSRLDNNRVVCEKCVWQNNPLVCSNDISISWGEKISAHCDLICAETLPALDYMLPSEKVYREPLSMCLDSEFWSPDLIIPDQFKLDRQPNEILIYHAVGNYEIRSREGRNIKGTPAVFAAIEKLKNEGYPVRLIFFTNMKNTEIRFMQSQADIIIDQLNIGRYGATAREGMMLGKPVICYMNPREMKPEYELQSLKECPLISATEESLYEQLKSIIDNRQLLKEYGHLSRQYALKWHSADECAKRYEEVYDELMERP